MNILCPKCRGTDYFMSQRNVVKGNSVWLRGVTQSVPVCRVCNEVMTNPLKALNPDERKQWVRAEIMSPTMWGKTFAIVFGTFIVVLFLVYFFS
jgi:DNA segregation ATPase FtsK/SpoIIIE-like protein